MLVLACWLVRAEQSRNTHMSCGWRNGSGGIEPPIMAKPISYQGASKVVALLNSGLSVKDIVDSYGRAVHPDAAEFCSYHKQAKRMAIVQAHEDLAVRSRLCELEAAHRVPTGMPVSPVA